MTNRIAEITANPIKYYTDGQPYFTIGDCEIRNHPSVEALARLDRLEKYIIPSLQSKLKTEQARAEAAEKVCYAANRYIKHINSHVAIGWDELINSLQNWTNSYGEKR